MDSDSYYALPLHENIPQDKHYLPGTSAVTSVLTHNVYEVGCCKNSGNTLKDRIAYLTRLVGKE